MSRPHSTYLLSLVGGELDVRKATWAGMQLYYVVPKGKARIRTQISAAHSREDLELAIQAFVDVKRELRI